MAGRVIISQKIASTVPKAEAKPEPGIEQPVIRSWQPLPRRSCRDGEVAHTDLHPDDRQPKRASKEVKKDRKQNPGLAQRMTGLCRKRDAGGGLSDDSGRGEEESEMTPMRTTPAVIAGLQVKVRHQHEKDTGPCAEQNGRSDQM
jgi:hypothetical protein